MSSPAGFSSLEDLVGPALVSTKFETLKTAEVAAGVDYVAVYSSASWCPPCRKFTPKLAAFYKDLKAKAPGKVEVIFNSRDKDKASFKEYFTGHHPWLAIPFEDRKISDKIMAAFGIRGIPSLLIFNAKTMELVTDKGTLALQIDTKGEGFPWPNKSLKEHLGDYFINAAGDAVTTDSLEGKHIGLFFSASWCPGCVGFFPTLVEAYFNIKAKRDDFEIIWVDAENKEPDYKDYLAKMPWLAVPYADSARKNWLSATLEAYSLPTLVILDKDMKTVITKKAVDSLARDSSGEGFPYPPEYFFPFVTENVGETMEAPALVVFAEECKDAALKASLIESVKALSKELHASDAYAKIPEERRLRFFWTTAGSSPADKQNTELLKKFFGIKSSDKPTVGILDLPARAYWRATGPGDFTKLTPEKLKEVALAFKDDALEMSPILM